MNAYTSIPMTVQVFLCLCNYTYRVILLVKQAQLGVPHSETQVGLQSYFNWTQVSVGGHRTYFVDEGGTIGVGTPYSIERKSLTF